MVWYRRHNPYPATIGSNSPWWPGWGTTMVPRSRSNKWVHASKPSVPHHFQHGSGHGYPTLGDGGGGWRSGAVGFWLTSSDANCVLLSGRWTPFIPTSRPDSGGPVRPDGTLWPGQIAEKCGKYGGLDIQAVLHGRPTLRGFVLAVGESVGVILQIHTEGEVHFPGMRSGPGVSVPGVAPPYPERNWAGTSVGRHPATGGPKDVPVIFPRTPVLVSCLVKVFRGGGGGDELHQPTNTLCTSPRVG